ncbi:hypothetical protein SAMN05660816_06051 [Niastella yeongjuensis]|nr:hypothetical protein SAMN05660816_06051 [Niastella yeongjuensis]
MLETLEVLFYSQMKNDSLSDTPISYFYLSCLFSASNSFSLAEFGVSNTRKCSKIREKRFLLSRKR